MIRTRLVAVVAAASLLAVACGGDDTPVTAPIDTDPPTSAVDQYSDGDEPTDASTPGAATESTDSSDETIAPVAGSGTLVPGDPATGKPEIQLPDFLPTELVITDLVEGTGDPVEAGDTVTVHYVGVLTATGDEFDNSYDRGAPFSVKVGAGKVIEGWDQGLLGAKVGGRRQLDIPAALAYGEAGAGGGLIPPGAPITFVVDIVDVEKPSPPPTLAPMADPADCPAPDGSSPQQREFTEYPPTCIDVTKTYTAEIVTNVGTLVVALDAKQAPVTVNNFVVLARYHYFDDTNCHRIVPGFMAQCGDPTASGSGGPGYRFADELPSSSEVYVPGALAMANAGPGTNGSQFFIMTGEAPWLPPDYSWFGNVTEGLDSTLPALDAAGDPQAPNGIPPLQEVIIESVTITES
jgi:peptidylprolyl isomerase/peptidyl-prolyl cis-trans isomerase B (cyclophilin B)